MGSPDGTCRFSAFTRPPFVATCPQGCGGPAPGRCAGWRGWEEYKRSEGEHLSTFPHAFRAGGGSASAAFFGFPSQAGKLCARSGRGDGRSNVPTPRTGVTHAPGRSPGTCQIPQSSLALMPFVNGNPEKLFKWKFLFFQTPQTSNRSQCSIPSRRPRKGLRTAGRTHASAARAQLRPTRAAGFSWGRSWAPAAPRSGEKGERRGAEKPRRHVGGQ